jgi:hypothetical protein
LKWFCLFIAISPSSYAEADGPDFWRLRDVPENDVLNLRLYADFRAPKIAEIPHDAECIRNMGCKGGLSYREFTTLSDAEKQRVLKQRPLWCRVSYQGRVGWVAGRYLQESSCTSAAAEESLPGAQGIDPYNHRYRIENETVVLRHGCSHKPIEGSAASIITEVARPPLYVDMNDDGLNDAVLILMQQTGGSGTFYYLAVALGGVASGPVVQSYFLGDRIKVEQLSSVDDEIIIDYLDRTKGQPMSVRPVLSFNKKFKFSSDKLLTLP